MLTVPTKTPLSGPPLLPACPAPPAADTDFLQVLGATLAVQVSPVTWPQAPPNRDPSEAEGTVPSRAGHPEYDTDACSAPPAETRSLPDQLDEAREEPAPAAAPLTASTVHPVLPPAPSGVPVAGTPTGNGDRGERSAVAEPMAPAGRADDAAPGPADGRSEAGPSRPGHAGRGAGHRPGAGAPLRHRGQTQRRRWMATRRCRPHGRLRRPRPDLGAASQPGDDRRPAAAGRR